MSFRLTITGVEEVNRMLRQIDRVAQKTVTKSAKAGANIAYRQAKRDAPVDKGALRKGIIMKAEKRKTGKKVYDIKFSDDPVFVKEAKYATTTKKVGKWYNRRKVTTKNRSFYPVSQEYGWMGKDGTKIIPKKAGFLRNALRQNRLIIKQKMTDVMAADLRAVIPR